MKQCLLLMAFVFMYQFAWAQLAEQPLHQSIPKQNKEKSTARIQSFPPISLPFWDDFSFRTPGYPDSLWTEYATVSFSDGIAIRPPTIYTASFDGLKADGTPYDTNDQEATGYTDVLTSQLIKMAEVPVPERGTVYFSFFFQWRGHGEAPDEEDFLAVEFLNSDTIWTEIDRIQTDGSFSQSIFYPKIYQVTAPYFHDEFQFRFRSHGRISGPYDMWHIDYVFLAKGRNATDMSFPDQAITSKLSPLFENYTSIPVNHFFNTKPLEAPTFGIYNLRVGLPEPLAYRVDGTFTNYIGDVPTTHQVLLRKGIPINAIPSLTHIQETIGTLPDPDDPLQFNPTADSILITLKTSLYTGDVVDSLGVTAVDYLDRYIPIDFRANDTINTSYKLKDYYAYDDGVAEFSTYLTRQGNQLAYQFDMLTSEVDTLIGFRAYFPFYGGATSILNVFVWGDDDGLPGNVLASRYNITLQKNGTNEFMDIFFAPAILVSNKFYVGWEEPANRVHIGLDKNHDTGDKIFVNTKGFWVQNDIVTGSLMIRPIFGGGDIVTSIENPDDPITLYPNPNNGSFHVDTESRIVAIHDLTGREISFTASPGDGHQLVAIKNPASGIYIVRSVRNGKINSQKIVVY